LLLVLEEKDYTNQLATHMVIQDIKVIQADLVILLPMVEGADLVTDQIKATQEPQAAAYN
jgi:hypothetical protein